MLISNENFRKMHKAQLKYNNRYSEFYKKLYEETNEKRYLNKSDTIFNCFKFQYWDKYEYNKILDNIAHDRCRNRFCLNCQILINSYHAHKLKPIIENLKKEGYSAYMLTLTVPNCEYKDLNKTIKKMNNCWNKFFKKYNADDLRSWKNRYVKIDGAIKVLEVTVNEKTQTFHPHFHILLLTMIDKKEKENYLKPFIQGRWSYKRQAYNYHSKLAQQMMVLWSMLYNDVRITDKNYFNWSVNPNDPENLEINLQEFYEKGDNDDTEKAIEDDIPNTAGFKELLKYTTKFDEINSYEVFKYLEKGLENVRRLQTSGILHGIIQDINEDNAETDGDIEELILEMLESPVKFKTYDLKILFNDLKEYKKIYRKNTSYDKQLINDMLNNM